MSKFGSNKGNGFSVLRAAVILFCTVHFLLSAGVALAASQDTALEGSDTYRVQAGVTGNLTSMGSDTLSNLMTAWTEAFEALYPGIHIEIQSAGSSTAPTALTQGIAQLGPMSRPMRQREIERFEQKFGYPPTAIKVAIDALAVYVHQDNPLERVSFEQLDAIFSRTLFCGAPQPITRWAQLGLDGLWAKRDIQLFGRNSVSGTYGYFKQSVLCQGDFVGRLNEQPGSASAVQAVSTSLNAIGFSGMGYQVAAVKPVAVSRDGQHYVEATLENVASGRYPLARHLYIYVNHSPDQAMRPLEKEFLRFILSADGQALVSQEGYVPLPGADAQQERIRLKLTQ